jgi:hypothetical protein
VTAPDAGRSEPEPFLVEPGWEWCDIIREAVGPSRRLLYYPNGDVRFEHRCDRGARGVIICAPALDPAHQISRNGNETHANPRGEPTITPSILCPDCGLHGFVTNGWWRA